MCKNISHVNIFSTKIREIEQEEKKSCAKNIKNIHERNRRRENSREKIVMAQNMRALMTCQNETVESLLRRREYFDEQDFH